MELVSKEESYAQRRQLFKNIWETAMQMDKPGNIVNKPRIIKTLRLDEMDKFESNKKKKERIKNLRTVCNKLLEFCNRHDPDETFYTQMVAKHELAIDKFRSNKPKQNRENINENMVKSVFTAHPDTHIAVAKPTKLKKEGDTKPDAKVKNVSGHHLSSKLRTVTISKAMIKGIKGLSSQNSLGSESELARKLTRRKRLKKKKSKRKKSFESSNLKPITTGRRLNDRGAAMKGGTVLRHLKQLLTVLNIKIITP